MSDPDIHAFQGIVTKLRTTRGSQYALNVMAEAADLIERQDKTIAATVKHYEGLLVQDATRIATMGVTIERLSEAWNMTHFGCNNPDHAAAYRLGGIALGLGA